MNEIEGVQLFRELSKLSLENAEQWTKDAKLLVGTSSLKHAAVLMQFASEEIAKFIVCWHVSERIFPINDNRIVREVFHSHTIKNHILFGFMLNLVQGTPLKEGFNVEDFERDVKFIEKGMPPRKFGEKDSLFQNICLASHKFRQICTYVDVDWKKGKVLTLEYASRPAAENIMNPQIAAEQIQRLENTISYMRKILERGILEQDMKHLREFYDSMPKEAWKTGEIPIEWFEKVNEADGGEKAK
jgi:AbiV family abortive infection protein